MKDQGAKEKLIPVGKHKGEPLEVLLTDLEAQQWWQNHASLQQKYPWVINFINLNGQVSRTPAHNRLQLEFFQEDFRRRTFSLYAQKTLIRRTRTAPFFNGTQLDGEGLVMYITEVDSAQPEVDNIDMQFGGEFFLQVRSQFPGTGLIPWSGPKLIPDTSPIFESHPYYVQFALARKLTLELKPFLGDDYPEVLRKMAAKKINCLFYDGYDGSATPEQLEEFFGSRGITVISKAEIEQLRLPTLRIDSRQRDVLFPPTYNYFGERSVMTGYDV